MEQARQYDEAAEYIRRRIKGNPQTAVILGSGLGNLADQIEQATVIPYAQIPHFVTSTALGHKGNLVCGRLGNQQIVAMQGRFHYYEGYTMQQVTFPIRVMQRLGIRYLLVSNAAGGINKVYQTGDLMIIRDHINMMPNPLIGFNENILGPRFPDMTHAYDCELIRRMEDIAVGRNILLHSGVYVGVTGPCYETPAECRFYAQMGGDAIGMSTVPEVIVARHAGLQVFGMSVVTNTYHSAADVVNEGAEVIAVAEKISQTMLALFTELITKL